MTVVAGLAESSYHPYRSMDQRWATKTRAEQEDEEVERLVRPAPKVKPPRHDRRREQVNPDRDPDIDDDPDIAKDPDRSRNYKDVGGSVRVFLRYAQEKVPARSRDTGKIVYIAPDTLKEKPGEYEAVDPAEAEAEKSKKPGKADPKKAPEAPAEGDDSFSAAGKAVRQMMKDDPALESRIKGITDPATQLGGLAKEHPGLPLAQIFKGVEFPAGLKTLGDAVKALQSQPAKKPGKKPKKEPPQEAVGEKTPEAPTEKPKKDDSYEDAHSRADAEREKAHDKAEADYERRQDEIDAAEEVARKKLGPLVKQDDLDALEKQFSEERAKLKKELEESRSQIDEKLQADRAKIDEEFGPTDEAEKASGKAKKPKAKKPPGAGKGETPDAAKGEALGDGEEEEEPSEEAKLALPPPKRREPTTAQRKEALLLIQDTFPPHIAAGLIARRMHPDDVTEMVATYARAKQRPVRDLNAFVEKASANYETDPANVKPPQMVKDASGKEVLFDSLSPEDKAEAYRKHQMKVVALSMAAKDMLSARLAMPSFLSGKPSIPPVVATTLATFMLRKGGDKHAEALTDKMYEASIRSGGKALSEGQAKKFLSYLPPAAKKLGQSYLQGVDYVHARNKFLGQGLGKFSEKDRAGAILSGLKKASKFFQDKAKAYGTDPLAAASPFKIAVLDRLRAIDPKKYAKVRGMLDVDEAKAYDVAHAQWKKDHAVWEAKRNAYEKQQDPYREKPFSDPEPAPPAKPSRYEIVKAKQRPMESDPWDEVGPSKESTPKDETESDKKAPKDSPGDEKESPVTKKSSIKVARRFISTCSGSPAMARDQRVAVYHGIDPKKHYPEAYPEWKQPHQCDLGEKDFQAILSSAKTWLKTPVLSKSIEGLEKDHQLRAALDLAIYDGPYNGQIQPTVYDALLARLGGGAKQARETEDSRVSSCPQFTKEETPMGIKASHEIRQFAARAASADPALGYDLIDLADKLASEEKKESQQQEEKKQSQQQEEKKQAQGEEQAKQASDKTASDKFAQLRSAVIRTASSDPAAFRPLLQLIKDLG